MPSDEPTPPPASCNITAATLLIRHSSILGNDDEFEMTMEPFIKKLAKIDKYKLPKEKDHPWYFLRHWKAPLNKENLEKLSEQGAVDAEVGSALTSVSALPLNSNLCRLSANTSVRCMHTSSLQERITSRAITTATHTKDAIPHCDLARTPSIRNPAHRTRSGPRLRRVISIPLRRTSREHSLVIKLVKMEMEMVSTCS